MDCRNLFYVFIPFKINGKFDSLELKKYVKENVYDCKDKTNSEADKMWSMNSAVKRKYLLKYISDKLNPDNENCQGYHLVLSDGARTELDYGKEDDWFTLIKESRKDDTKESTKDEDFKYQIKKIHLYMFSSGIGIFAFEMINNSSDPYMLAEAQYYIKKVARNRLCGDGSDKPEFTLYEISKKILEKMKYPEASLFFYSVKGEERANIFTYVEVPEDNDNSDWKKELYYLRRCYQQNYDYCEAVEIDKNELHIASDTVKWAISEEAIACRCEKKKKNVSEEKGDIDTSFEENDTFFKNIKEHYLYMYVLLLHQKYVLYNLLTDIGPASANNLVLLENYKTMLTDFETNFMFNYVTEVPQYQKIYTKVQSCFHIDVLYKDVIDPINDMTALKDAEREEGMNKFLFVLSILGIVSAFTDFAQLVDEGWKQYSLWTFGLAQWIHFGASLALCGVFAFFIYKYSYKKKRKK